MAQVIPNTPGPKHYHVLSPHVEEQTGWPGITRRGSPPVEYCLETPTRNSRALQADERADHSWCMQRLDDRKGLCAWCQRRRREWWKVGRNIGGLQVQGQSTRLAGRKAAFSPSPCPLTQACCPDQARGIILRSHQHTGDPGTCGELPSTPSLRPFLSPP